MNDFLVHCIRYVTTASVVGAIGYSLWLGSNNSSGVEPVCFGASCTEASRVTHLQSYAQADSHGVETTSKSNHINVKAVGDSWVELYLDRQKVCEGVLHGGDFIALEADGDLDFSGIDMQCNSERDRQQVWSHLRLFSGDISMLRLRYQDTVIDRSKLQIAQQGVTLWQVENRHESTRKHTK